MADTTTVKLADGTTLTFQGKLDREAVSRKVALFRAAQGIKTEAMPEQAGSISRFGSSLINTLSPLPAGAPLSDIVEGPAMAARKPSLLLDVLKQVPEAQGMELEKAREAQKSGDWSKALMHGMAYLIPVLGPQLAHAGEQMAGGDIAGGLGTTTGVAGQILAPELLNKGAKATQSVGRSIGSAASSLRTSLSEALPSRLNNSILKTPPIEFRGGIDPGLTVAKEGLFGGTKGSLLKKIQGSADQIGQQIASQLNSPQASAAQIDVANAINSVIDTQIRKSGHFGESSAVARLENLREGLLNSLLPDVGIQQGKGPPLQAFAVKEAVMERTRFKTSGEVEPIVNETLLQIYGKLSKDISEAVPEVAALNPRYAGLRRADVAFENEYLRGKSKDVLGATALGTIGKVAPTLTKSGLATILAKLGRNP